VAATGSAGARLPLSRASPNGSAACGGDRQRHCAPPVVADESEWLRGMWRRLTLPVRASDISSEFVGLHARGSDWHCRCAPPFVVGGDRHEHSQVLGESSAQMMSGPVTRFSFLKVSLKNL